MTLGWIDAGFQCKWNFVPSPLNNKDHALNLNEKNDEFSNWMVRMPPAVYFWKFTGFAKHIRDRTLHRSISKMTASKWHLRRPTKTYEDLFAKPVAKCCSLFDSKMVFEQGDADAVDIFINQCSWIWHVRDALSLHAVRQSTAVSNTLYDAIGRTETALFCDDGVANYGCLKRRQPTEWSLFTGLFFLAEIPARVSSKADFCVNYGQNKIVMTGNVDTCLKELNRGL